jgi:hypothetical protein
MMEIVFERIAADGSLSAISKSVARYSTLERYELERSRII